MTRQRPGLGKGLDALIPLSESRLAAEPTSGVTELPIEQIVRNPRQPRTQFDPEGIAELAASIQQHGIIQPLIVTREAEGQYTLIAGERRLLAARQAGLQTIPVLVREASEQARLELALIENIQRADLNALETAEAYRQLAEDFQLSHSEIAQRVGKSRVAVTNTLRLLNLPASIQSALLEGKISEGHARALLALPTPQSQAAALQTILQNHLNVRQTEELVRKLSGEKPPQKARPAPAPEITALEERLRASLGTRVSLKQGRKGGTILIHYYSDEELDALIETLARNG
jgi:ParB family chromosome partitioning protein